MVTSMADDLMIACHEAGHAIVAIRHEIPFTSAEVGPNEYGVVAPAYSPIDGNRDEWSDYDLAKYQQFFAAGVAAERILFNEERAHASASDKSCHDRIEHLRVNKRTNGFEDDIQDAMKLLDATSIRAVAAQLRIKQKLTIEEVCAVIGCTPWWE